jgi:hypothetical protein
MKRAPIFQCQGFTLVEMLISIPCGIIAMLMLFAMSQAVMDLIGRNVSINLAHVYTRNPMDRIRQDIFKTALASNGASNLLQLTGPWTSGAYPAVTGSGPAAGISMEVSFAGPYQIASNCNGNSTNVAITVPAGNLPVSGGMNLAIPSYGIDAPISSASTSGSTVTCTLGTPLLSSTSSGLFLSATNAISVYITLPTHYYVSGSQLIRRDGTGVMTVIQNNVVNALPFSQPPSSIVGAAGTFLAVNLAGSNPDYSNFHYKGSDMSYPSIWIPVMGPLSYTPVLSSTLY